MRVVDNHRDSGKARRRVIELARALAVQPAYLLYRVNSAVCLGSRFLLDRCGAQPVPTGTPPHALLPGECPFALCTRGRSNRIAQLSYARRKPRVRCRDPNHRAAEVLDDSAHQGRFPDALATGDHDETAALADRIAQSRVSAHEGCAVLCWNFRWNRRKRGRFPLGSRPALARPHTTPLSPTTRQRPHGRRPRALCVYPC